MPAEVEPHAAIWMGWPKDQWYTDSALDTRPPIAGIMTALAAHGMDVQLMCTDQAGERDARRWLAAHGFSLSARVNFVHVDQVDIWLRDYGPTFTRNGAGQLGMARFRQSQWGYATVSDPVSAAMTRVPDLVADYLGIERVAAVDFVSEGGDRIVNGHGTMLVSRTVEGARNPGAAQSCLDRGYRAALGVTNVIRLDSGLGVDLHSTWGPVPYRDRSGATILLYGPQTTGGHLDELVRFAGPRAILLAQVTADEAARDPLAALHYACGTAIARALRQAADQCGGPFAVVQLPVPEVEYLAVEPGEPMYQWLAELDYPADVPAFPHGRPIHVVKAASYANYLVTNGLVLAPGYGNAEKDDAAAATLEAAYPGRTVVQIDPSAINFAGGGIHCCTAEQPGGAARQPDGGGNAP
ncbi:MAG: agmatine deiminase family protein [Spirochaetaceae bacterium]|nr:agmatine deiminase family protein [Spirochaetaceae bacterium]